MSCERWREAVSARLDGEDPGMDGALLDAHLARCADCRAFEASAATARREQRIGVAPVVPDLSRRVRKAVALADRAGRWSIVRALLVVVAVQIVAFSLPALVLGDEQDTGSHAARHLGAFTVAYGVGLLVVAVRPARARAMLPVAAVLAGTLLITAVVDLVDGRIPLVGEAEHLPELLSVVLVWLLATPSGRRDRASRTDPRRPVPSLRLVDDDRADDATSAAGE
jgi:predicted anti-sigma-YlaC factor YlaD